MFLEPPRSPNLPQKILAASKATRTDQLNGFRETSRILCDQTTFRPYFSAPICQGTLHAAKLAQKLGKESATIGEFWVWNEDRLDKMVKISQKITNEDGIHFRIAGFESGKKLAPVFSQKNPPEIWPPKVFASNNISRLQERFNGKAHLHIGKDG